MNNFKNTYISLLQHGFEPWLPQLLQLIQNYYKNKSKDFNDMQKIIDKLPQLDINNIDFEDKIELNLNNFNRSQQTLLRNLLMRLKPWRKGPFKFNDLLLDSEWRSDFKWLRLKSELNLAGKKILDVGCNNGYHMFLMQAQQAELVVGADPTFMYYAQFCALKKLFNLAKNPLFLPIFIEQLDGLEQFDVVFSMGVLYHQKSPLDHLLSLKKHLKKGGELVLETLVIEGDERTVLIPNDRYAMMKNVYFIPSVAMLKLWLKKLGFSDIRLIDENKTTILEQRASEFSCDESLQDFLDPNDDNKTIEGYPAPVRAILLAKK